MTSGVRGRLISTAFARHGLYDIAGAGAPIPPATAGALRVLAEKIDATLGPASSIRAITDVAVIPLLRLLGFDIRSRTDDGACTILQTAVGDVATAPAMVFGWDE